MTERYIPDWEELNGGNPPMSANDQEMISVTRETLRYAKMHMEKSMAEEYYHTTGAACREITDALEKPAITPKEVKEAMMARLDTWMKQELKFLSIVHRPSGAPKWEGEPFMSMEIAKDLVRKAVRKF